LNFVGGNDEFKLSTGGRIVPGQASFNLYVLRVYQGGPPIGLKRAWVNESNEGWAT
jgi:hypothetical protein